jgi:hypothetical protein
MSFWTGICDSSSLLESVDCSAFKGQWDGKLWPNTPGPFYGADTDSCGTGPIEAPSNSGQDENGFEYIFKQPASPTDVHEIVEAAKVNVFSGYGIDGNLNWTLRLIRE